MSAHTRTLLDKANHHRIQEEHEQANIFFTLFLCALEQEGGK